MKKFIILLISLAFSISGQSQSRKYISQFNNVQGYYNPALTGFEGSMLRGLVRNQWAGWEGAPRNNFASAELDFSQLSGEENSEVLGKNALGAYVLSDEYGPFRETEFIASYSSRIRVSKNANLRLGLGVNFKGYRLDGNNLNTEQSNDPILGQYLGQFTTMNTIDFNVGMALTHNNYYIAYSLNQLSNGNISSGDIFLETIPSVSVISAGYRKKVSENISIASSILFRSQSDLPENFEINFKAVLMDRLWIGGGHRADFANNIQVGVLFNKLRMGYVYEIPNTRSFYLPQPTHELMISFQIFGNQQAGLIW